MMGMPGYLNWLSWFTVCIVSASFTNAIVTLLVCVDYSGFGAVVTNSNFFVFFLLLTFYATALIFFIFAMSTLFNNGKQLRALLAYVTQPCDIGNE